MAWRNCHYEWDCSEMTLFLFFFWSRRCLKQTIDIYFNATGAASNSLFGVQATEKVAKLWMQMTLTNGLTEKLLQETHSGEEVFRLLFQLCKTDLNKLVFGPVSIFAGAGKTNIAVLTILRLIGQHMDAAGWSQLWSWNRQLLFRHGSDT